ncbi:hypothetical protein [Anaeromicropila populeti]|uniref:Butirosin biosynthesis protein H, N-terminal n=1 Tax=Anaeromicropila populeti TaxID=37658 RepID=A0A1I6IN53_9FIRM|nr:hypothetical protein [Anaeromicropila populeti]SFR68175.1 hypothetical protein SAMN05661086_00933 [Anaeromicropila populeti]
MLPKMEKEEKSKTRNILKLSDPLICAWPDHSFLTSLILNMNTGYDWIMNMYVQTYGSYFKVGDYVEETKLDHYPFANQNIKAGMTDVCPFVNRYLIPRDDIIRTKYRVLFDFVKEFIDKEYYITITLDRISLIGIRIHTFTKEEYDGPPYFLHAVNIYGYDLEKGVVYCTDNFEKGRYISKEIRIEDLNYSFSEVPLPDFISEFEQQVKVYRNYPYCEWKFDKVLLIGLLKDYLEPRKNIDYLYNFVITPFKDTTNIGKFGIESYDLLVTYLQEFIDGKRSFLNVKDSFIDKRAFSYLKDHKRLMRLRVEYLMKNEMIEKDDNFLNQFIELEKKADILLNLCIKADLAKSKKYVEKTLLALDNFRNQDERLIRELLDKLKENKKM